jgi:hypothetical protein
VYSVLREEGFVKKYSFIAFLVLGLMLPALAQSTAGQHSSPLVNAAWQWPGANRGYHGVLAAEWQQKFDSYYQRWLQYRATSNWDEVGSMEGRMYSIMDNYRIPRNVPFDAVASPGLAGNQRWGDRDRDGYYARAGWQGRLPADDQRRFDSYYQRWLQYRSQNDRDEIVSMEKRMQDVYSHNGIPPNTPYEAVASQGIGQGDRGGYYPRAGGQRRLSADDQRRFDSYYQRWLQYRAQNNRDEIVSMEKRMQDVYSHNGIPANTPYDAVASPGIGQRY